VARLGAALCALATTACPMYRVADIRAETARLRMTRIFLSIARYTLDHRQAPTQEQGLRVLLEKRPQRTPGADLSAYLTPADLIDPWGAAYRYRVSPEDGALTIESDHDPHVVRCEADATPSSTSEARPFGSE
jgi:hypothetical protein